MAFYLGSTKVLASDNTGVFPIPQSNGYDRGTSIYNNGTSAYFAYPGNPNETIGGTFETRSILTHGFVCGGYKNSNPWRTVHKCWHATDITFSCGEQLSASMAYGDACFSDYNGYIFGIGGQGSYAQTGSINLHTGQARNRLSNLNAGDGGSPGLFGSASMPYGYGGNDANAASGAGSAGQDDPARQSITYGTSAANTTDTDIYIASGVGGWAMNVQRDGCGAGTNQTGQEGYITGGGSTVTNRLHFGTEIMYTTTDSGMSGNYGSAAHGQYDAFFNCGGTKKYITYSNQTWYAYTSTQSTDGHGKWLSTKKGWHYQGQGGNTSSRYFTKFSESTRADISTTLDRGFNAGEENHHMGQDKGYCLGEYDGQQNNKSWYITYSNDTITLLGSAGRPKGHYGMSSAGSVSAAASVTSSRAV
jgi:hypothetical protein